MLSYLFLAVFINLYFKTKHSNERFDLGFYSLSNVFSYRRHISSKNYISVLTISGKSRNLKIIAPSPPPLPRPFYYQPPSILWYSLNIRWGSFYYDPPPIFRYFSETPPLPPSSSFNPPSIKHRRVNVLNPTYMQDLFYLRFSSGRSNNIAVVRKNTNTYGTKSLKSLRPQIWNSLPEHIKAETSFAHFWSLIDT